jgi:hypothetical protein
VGADSTKLRHVDTGRRLAPVKPLADRRLGRFSINRRAPEAKSPKKRRLEACRHFAALKPLTCIC